MQAQVPSAVASRPYLSYLRRGLAVVLGITALYAAISTYHWPLLWDAQVFHYGNFLREHGFAPYRDIVDMNLPGSYLIDGWAIKIFGPSDAAWRVFDFVLLGILTLAMMVIAKPYDWFAGLFAGAMFSLVHLSEGPWNAGQRDEIMTVLIMVGCAFLFESRRQRRPWIALLFGLSMGMASSIKPTAAPLALLLPALALWDLKREGEALSLYIWSTLFGAFVAAAIVAGFLAHYHAAAALLEISRRLTSFYAGLDHMPFHLMLRFSLPLAAYVLLPFSVSAAWANRYRTNWEYLAILTGGAFGALSYFLQHKGYAYHRYTFIAFVFLWMALELCAAMRKTRWVKAIGIAGVSVGVLLVAPFYMQLVLKVNPVNLFTPALEHDLARIGTERLQHDVQCLDMVDGCMNALYHLRVVQSTGTMGDLLLFAPQKNPVVDYYRSQFWDSLVTHPPAVIVMSNEWFNRVPTFDKLNQWPQFSDYLQKNYRIVVTRTFDQEWHFGYRIYLRDGVVVPPFESGDASQHHPAVMLEAVPHVTGKLASAS